MLLGLQKQKRLERLGSFPVLHSLAFASVTLFAVGVFFVPQMPGTLA